MHLYVFIEHLKYYPPRHADAESPAVVEFSYIPGKNTEPALEAPPQAFVIIEVFFVGTPIATFTDEHRRRTARWR
jgi:hypothetical protein